MKKISQITLGLGIVFSLSAFLPGDNCTMYAPSSQGAEMELKTYDAKDNLTSYVRQKVMGLDFAGTTPMIKIHSDSYDKKDKLVGSSDYVLSCENGVFMADMKSMISQDQQSSTKDMKVNIVADKLDIPADPKAGQILKDGSINMVATSEGSPITLKFSTKVTNRKVAAIEEVVVPAGTFTCVKITYDAEVKNIFTVKVKVAEWYAKNIGMVRGETYSTNDKLQSYTVLSSKK